jgi:hypothetical protein
MTSALAFLRVYEPLAAFEGETRRRWQEYAETARREPAAGVELERLAALRALVGPAPAVLPAIEEHAHVTEVDGVTLVCPWATRVRSLEALEEFLLDVPAPVQAAYLPEAVALAAEAELEDWRTSAPDARTHQLSATWHVPLRWFVLVDSAEREVDPGQGPLRTGRRLARDIGVR